MVIFALIYTITAAPAFIYLQNPKKPTVPTAQSWEIISTALDPMFPENPLIKHRFIIHQL